MHVRLRLFGQGRCSFRHGRRTVALIVAAFLLGTGFAASHLHAQGNLTPPGAPAPTMKTLDQVEARTAIPRPSDLSGGNVVFPIVLSASGSYYLTQNLTVASGDVIRITAGNVTLDLNGFTVATTSATPSGTGVLIQNSRATVLNGFVYGPGTVSGSGSYTGGGFVNGVAASAAGSNVTVRNLTVSGCYNSGVDLAPGINNANNLGSTGLVEFCAINNVFGQGTTVFGRGIGASVVRACTVTNIVNGLGIFAGEVSDSSANAGQGGIYAQNATNCFGVGDSGAGVVTTATARGCTGVSNSSSGLSSSQTATACTGKSTSSVGLKANTATNCEGVSTSNDGIQAIIGNDCRGTTSTGGNGITGDVLTNCVGVNSGSGLGLYADKIATSCYGSSATGYGLRAATAIGSFGQNSSTTNAALYVVSAINCRGYNSAGGFVILADNAITCTTQQGAISAGYKNLGTP